MYEQHKFSNVTKTYLCRFYEILEEMIAGMTDVEITDSLSCDFIVQMIPHHEAAIEMSCNLLQYTTCVPLQEIALHIVDEQTQSIENMKCVLDQCSQLKNSRQDLCLYLRNYQWITHTMFTQMRDACSTNNLSLIHI